MTTIASGNRHTLPGAETRAATAGNMPSWRQRVKIIHQNIRFRQFFKTKTEGLENVIAQASRPGRHATGPLLCREKRLLAQTSLTFAARTDSHRNPIR